MLCRQHWPVVSVEGCNGERLVGTKAHYGAYLTGGRDILVDIVHISRTFNNAASDRLLLVLMQLLLMMIITSMLR